MVASTERWRSARRRSSAATPAPQVAEQLGRGPAERPRRGKLDGQREPVEEATDLGDGGVVVGRRSEAWTHRGGAVEEQLDGRVVDAERSDGHGVLAGDPEAMAARRQHDRIGGAGEDRLDQLGDAVEHVLAVVEDEQRPGPTEVLDDPPRQVTPAAVVEAERRRDGADDGPRAADRCQLAQQHTSGKRSATATAVCSARRVLPTPPGPMSVTSRARPSNSTAAVSSSWRPTNELPGTPIVGVPS